MPRASVRKLVWMPAYKDTHDMAFRADPVRWQLVWGFAYGKETTTIPLWFPFLLLATPATLLWWRDFRHRFPAHACQSCGYDLSGAAHEKCPECSAQID